MKGPCSDSTEAAGTPEAQHQGVLNLEQPLGSVISSTSKPLENKADPEKQ